MDYMSPVIDAIARLWDCCAHRASYICELKKNHKSLRTSLDSLKCQRYDLIARIELAESNPTDPANRTHVVTEWLKVVEDLERELEDILQQGDSNRHVKNEVRRCFRCYVRKSCWSDYKHGKLVVKKLKVVEKLRRDGNFSVVVGRSPPDPVREMSIHEVVGMNQLDDIWRLLVTDENIVRIVGLYGMGGVGKTTLLKKVNNEFGKRNHCFDVVIWVVVSKDLNLENIQRQIGKSLGMSWPDETAKDEKANDIFKVLKNKKFVLLLDDIWQRVDLEAIGIPNLGNNKTNSKVVFTTRSLLVSGMMEAGETIKVECLQWDKAWSLFQEKVGQQSLNCHPNVPELAKKVAEECLGLPLSLVTIGRTMASKRSLQEWQHALCVLQKSASKFS
ncbi:hypothetical protein MKW98_016666, partial [Papaver atlanticum]